MMEVIFFFMGCVVFAFFWWFDRDRQNQRFSDLERDINDLRSRFNNAEHSKNVALERAALLASPTYQSLRLPENAPLIVDRKPVADEPDSTGVDGKTAHVRVVSSNAIISDPQNGTNGEATPTLNEAIISETNIERVLEEKILSEDRPNIEPKPTLDNPLIDLFDKLKENWMVALGGLCVALAGIFLAKLAMEQGFFGPLPRIILGLLTGLALQLSAEHFRRKTGESNPVFGALAGGGSITLFAVLLVAMNHYHMIPREIGFVLLVAVAMGTMLLAVLHGPALAAIGIIGAYIVPLFVTTGSGQIPLALAYSVIVTASGLFLLNHVFRVWLWNGLFIGALAWWCFSLKTPDIAIAQGLYLPAIFYLFLAIPNQNWTLQQPYKLDEITPLSFMFLPTSLGQRDHILVRGLLAIVVLQVVYWPFTDHLSTAIYAWMPLFVLSLFAARKRESFTLIPWVMVLLELFGFMTRSISLEAHFFEGDAAFTRIVFSLAVTGVAVAFGALNLRTSKYKLSWSAFITGVPLLMALSCFLSLDGIGEHKWAMTFGVMTVVYRLVAIGSWRKNSALPLLISSLFCGHFAASMTAMLLTENATLTLVLALQMVSLAWIIKQFKLKQAGWLFKLLTTIVLIRLTLNPMVLVYDSSTHWSLIAYGGSLACSLISMRLLGSYPRIRNWAEVAAMLLLVLFSWSELRYWFHDGDIFSPSASLLERCLMMILFTGISIFYHRRSLVSEHLKTLYRMSSAGLLLWTVLIYLFLLSGLFSQAEWFVSAIGSTPIFNMILLGFGIPILLGWLTSRYHEPTIKIAAIGFGAVTTFVFINLEIRHLWQGSLDLSSPMGNGESYTYSIVWLIAMGVIFMRLLDSYPKIRNWVEASSMLLWALFSWCELRYWIHGDVFSGSASFLERVLTMILLTGLSFLYHRRSVVFGDLKKFYQMSSIWLLLGTLLVYLSLLSGLLSQGEWFVSAIGSTPIFNMILLGFGMPILLGWLVSRFHEPTIDLAAIGFGAIATFVFINLEIRHLWQGSLDFSSTMGNAELYTYSIVWLSIAILTTLAGAFRSDEIGKQIYQIGMGLLGLVIFKIFLVDAANLDGILRVLSFMGLGLSLLGLAYVHQRIKAKKKETTGELEEPSFE